MMKKILLTPIFLFSLIIGLNAAPHYEFTPLALKAYRSILASRLTEATAYIVQMRLTDPENLLAYYLEDYIDTMIVFVDEDAATFKKYLSNKDKRLEKLARGPQESPYYLFTQAEVQLHWALARTKASGFNITSLREASAAYKLLAKNEKKHPLFMPNKKTISVLRAAFGSVPPEFRWATNLLTGIDGNIERGRRELAEVVAYAKNNPSFVYGDETHLTYAFTILYLGNQAEDAWTIVKNSNLKPEKSILAALAIANVGLKSGHASDVVEYLKKAPKSKQYFATHFVEYFLGVSKLSLLSNDANQNLQNFVQQTKGKTFVKEAYQKLAWYDLILGNESGYWANMRLVKSKGANVAEGDKAALREAERGIKPDVTLLKARLLFDGGQYERALQLMQEKNKNDFVIKAFQLEYIYRLGRINHKLNRIPEAANLYQQTITEGEQEDYVFACNAALQLGLIYEQQNNKVQAKNYYNKCLELSPSEHAYGLHQKAKAGLGRIGA